MRCSKAAVRRHGEHWAVFLLGNDKPHLVAGRKACKRECGRINGEAARAIEARRKGASEIRLWKSFHRDKITSFNRWKREHPGRGGAVKLDRIRLEPSFKLYRGNLADIAAILNAEKKTAKK